MKKILINFLMACVFALLSTSVYAQADKLHIRGVVVDTADPPQSVIGATVYIKGTTVGAVCDDAGFFSIDAKKEDILVFSCLGYKDVEYRVTRSVANLSIALPEDSNVLEQAVVTGMTSQQRKHIAAAVGVIDKNNFTNKPVTQLSQALAGGTTGLLVTQGSGDPGGDNASIKIRGVASLLGTSPLVLVDGFEFDMNKLDPATVESVTILKDAAAASIYGAKAGNGVILITTKRGTAGTVTANYNGYAGVQTPMYVPQIADSWDYMQYVNEYQMTNGQAPMYTAEDIAMSRSGEDPVNYPNTQWGDLVLRKVAPITEHNLSVSGGNTTARFAISAQYLHQDGIYQVQKNCFDRFTIRANTSVNITKNISMFVDSFFGRDTRNYPSSNFISELYDFPTTIVAKYPAKEGVDRDYYGLYYQGTVNMLAELEHGTKVTTQRDYVSINVRPQWKIIDGLTLKGNFGYRLSSGMDKKDQDPYVFFNYYTEDEMASYSSVKTVSYTTRSTFWQGGINLDWVKEFGNGHRINLLGGFSSELNASTGWDNISLSSFYGKGYYSWKDRYLLEAGLRADGSSLFSGKNKWGFFPSVAAGWNISKEQWMQDVKPISNWKLRASFGMLGNNGVSPYSYQSLINASSGIETKVGNPDLKWETVKIYDVGTDLSFFDYKLDFTFDWFLKDVNDLIMNIPAPPSSAILTSPSNVGRAEVQGCEIALSYKQDFGDNISISASAGYTYQRSMWKYIPQGQLVNGNSIYKEGHALKANYFYVADGLLTKEEMDNHVAIWGGYPDSGSPAQRPGDIKFVDINHDGIIDENDRTAVGDQEPHHIYYATFTMKLWGFDIDMQLTGQGNSNRFWYGKFVQPLSSASQGAVQKWQLNHWTESNPDKWAPRPRLSAVGSYNELLSTYWMYNGAFARIKYIQVGYNFTKWAKAIHAKTLRLYVNAQNPFTFTSNKVVDPEISSNGGTVVTTYPIFKTYTIGLNIGF
ncbi:MAG: TonB-dependent receptor [Bacteroidales bacterium]|nr:TonB-dependent receptor [Bacteroidales bacterium]